MKKLATILLACLCLAWLHAVSIQHVSPQTFTFGEDSQLTVEVLQGLSDIAEMKLNFRMENDKRWLTEVAKPENPGSVYYKVNIPGKYLNTDPVEYYFSIKLNHGISKYFPAQDGVTPNYKLVSDLAEGDASPGFVLLTDEPSVSADNGYLLVVSFFQLVGEIDPAGIEVWVNGKNVTSSAMISAPTIVYKEDRPTPGNKKTIIRAKLGTKSIHSHTWTTEVLPGSRKIARPMNLRGSINFASNVYDYSLANGYPFEPEDDAVTWADLYANYGKLDMQTNLLFSSLERSNKQPVNRYSFGFKLPHLDLFLGDYAPAISQFTLFGKNLRGFYSKLYSKNVSLIVSHGQTVRKTTNETDLDPTVAGDQKSGSFKQEALGTRLQFGNENSFMMGFNLSRHRDVISSLDSSYYMYEKLLSDNQTETIYTTTAKDNAVLSYDIRINIPEQRTVLGGEIAGSFLNSNSIPGPISQSDLENYTGEDLMVDPSEFSNLFVINKNMEPLIPSRASTAWTIYFRSYFWNNLIGAQYSETGSAFNALGTSFQMQDSKALTLTDQLNLSRYFVLNGGLNFNEDNLMQHKSETTSGLSWNASAILRLPRIPYLKAAYFSSNGKNKANPKVATTLIDKISRNSSSLSFGIGYNISQIPVVPTQLDISYRIGEDDSDKVDSLAVLTQLTDNENNGLNITMLNRFTIIPLTLQFAMSANNQKQLILLTENKNSSFLFGAGYSLWQNRVKPYLNYRMVSLSENQGDQNYGYFTLGAEALPLSSLSVNTSLGFSGYSNKNDSSKDYNNLIWRVLLTQRF